MNKTLKIKGNVCLLASAAYDILLGVSTGFLLRGGNGVNFLSHTFCPYPAFAESGKENVHRYLGTGLINVS